MLCTDVSVPMIFEVLTARNQISVHSFRVLWNLGAVTWNLAMNVSINDQLMTDFRICQFCAVEIT